jgi:hypothetical protein
MLILVGSASNAVSISDVALNVVTIIFRTILLDQSMDQLASHLKKGGIKDILLFFPSTKREVKHLETHFKAAGLPQVVDWYVKKQYNAIKEGIMAQIKEMREQEESTEDVRQFIFFILLQYV